MKPRKPDKAYALISYKKGYVWIASIRPTRKEVVAYANAIRPWPWDNGVWQIKPINVIIEARDVGKKGGD